MPKVSVITPCYNAVPFIEWAIESLRRQTLTDWEHVVVDDGSADGSAALVEDYTRRDPRVRLRRQPNEGVCHARNAGFAAAAPDSEYLWFLDADDALDPTALQVMTDYLDACPAVGLVHCDYRLLDAEDRPLEAENVLHCDSVRWTQTSGGIAPIAPDSPETPFGSLFAWNEAIPSVSLIRRSVYVQTAGWNEALGQGFEELDLFLQIALHSRFHYLPQALVSYHVHAHNASHDSARLWTQERKLHDLWLGGEHLTKVQQEQVWAAWRFRERVLMPRLCLRWAADSAAKGARLEACKHVYRAGRHLQNYAASLIRRLSRRKAV